MEDESFTDALRWIFGVGAALAICYMIGIALGVTRAEAPAWVQAIGSIGAIGFTWLMATHHQRSQEKQRRNDVLQHLMQKAELCAVLTKDAKVVLGNISGKFHKSHSDNEWEEIGTERLHGLLSAVDALFSKDIPAILFSVLLPVQRELSYTLTAVRQYNHEKKWASQIRVEKSIKRLRAVEYAHTNVNSVIRLYQADWVSTMTK